MTLLTTNVQIVMLALLALLAASSLTIFAKSRLQKNKDFTELFLRTKTWWLILILFFLAISFTKNLALFFFAFISYLALKEFLTVIPTRRADRRVLFWIYLTVPIQYYWLSIGWYGMFIVFIPIYVFMFIPTRMVLAGETRGFLNAVSTLQWGVMTTVFCLSHLAALFLLSPEHNPPGGSAGLVLFLFVTTQWNDVSQYVFGKSFGKTKVVPTVSPGKTRVGLLGGCFSTVLFSWAVSPYLTPASGIQAATIGLMISLGGFMGDVTLSAVKRDLGIKDSGSLLPGHGGLLDRLDSLTFTAPLYFHYIDWIYRMRS